LAELGVACEVIAPTLVPMKAGDRVKMDRRDVERLTRSFRSGDLTPVWVPDEGSEALRDLVRARECSGLRHQCCNHKIWDHAPKRTRKHQCAAGLLPQTSAKSRIPLIETGSFLS